MSTISEETTLTPKQKAQAAIEALGLTMEAKFVPFSQSRNKAEKHKSLNWIVAIKRNGRDVLTTDYMAGAGHCPAYKTTKPPMGWQRDLKHWKHYAEAHECENGFAAKIFGFGASDFDGIQSDKKKPILPDIADVLYSLSMDASVLDHASYESFASEYGYDVDSRKGEAIYRACLELALKLRAAIGEAGLAQLAEAFQDF